MKTLKLNIKDWKLLKKTAADLNISMQYLISVVIDEGLGFAKEKILQENKEKDSRS